MKFWTSGPHFFCWDGGLVIRLRTRDQGALVQIPPGPSDFSEKNLSHVCSSSLRCINGYPDRAVFVQGCYSLSVIKVSIHSGV